MARDKRNIFKNCLKMVCLQQLANDPQISSSIYCLCINRSWNADVVHSISACKRTLDGKHCGFRLDCPVAFSLQSMKFMACWAVISYAGQHALHINVTGEYCLQRTSDWSVLSFASMVCAVFVSASNPTSTMQYYDIHDRSACYSPLWNTHNSAHLTLAAIAFVAFDFNRIRLHTWGKHFRLRLSRHFAKSLLNCC